MGKEIWAWICSPSRQAAEGAAGAKISVPLFADLAQGSKVSQNLDPLSRHGLLNLGDFVQIPATRTNLWYLFLSWFHYFDHLSLCHTPRHWSLERWVWRQGLYHLHGYCKKNATLIAMLQNFCGCICFLQCLLRSAGLSSAAWWNLHNKLWKMNTINPFVGLISAASITAYSICLAEENTRLVTFSHYLCSHNDFPARWQEAISKHLQTGVQPVGFQEISSDRFKTRTDPEVKSWSFPKLFIKQKRKVFWTINAAKTQFSKCTSNSSEMPNIMRISVWHAFLLCSVAVQYAI